MPTKARQRTVSQFLCCVTILSLYLGLTPVAASSTNPGSTAPSPPHQVLTPDGAVRSGFDSTQLPATDDGSSSLVALGFSINFFGQPYSGLYVNNNGNLTFDGALSTFTPFGLLSTSHVIIAPFFADVDTREGNVVTYGSGTVGGRPAFGANWPGVGCFSRVTSVLNYFQVLLIDRADIGPGDFDIELNYDQIQWEAGTASGGSANCQGGDVARAGYSNGTTAAFELPGSGTAGAFLDSNTQTGLIHNSRNSLQPGRYVFEVRNGIAPTGGTISGRVYDVSPSNPVAGALVQVCRGQLPCATTNTTSAGQYQVSGLEAGDYLVTAYPPASMPDLSIATIGPLVLPANGTLIDRDLTLVGPNTPPPGTTLQPGQTGANGMPLVHWQHELTLTHQDCEGGIASFEIFQGSNFLYGGPMFETSPGIYTATIPPLHPFHGYARVRITVICPGSPPATVEFDIYIDPSGHVRNTLGEPLAGATVTLYRADVSSGPFDAVPDGSAVMSPENRRNPDVTNAEGRFGWNVFAGYYKVRAQASACHAPGDPQTPYVETGVMVIPPPVTDLDLRLDCTASAMRYNFLPMVKRSP